MKKYKIVITYLAKVDVKKARDYYKNISANLAKQFLERIKEAKIFITENPNANDIIYQDIRMHLLKQFPYHLHYFLDEERNQIVVIAIEFAKRENLDFSERK
ncbi:type II toxin-antitoxin system RelE/ParE family toxin [Epilithonimonas hispanica]|uniref:Type II toxin-antitoxin system RelE/ParE family toxin n=1 Tax=Epilithonimonas hispanica TaxID=358687 RepID=A0A3D9CS72_9FLAO|nr:type II toxin-antitoxin system RelE/ParE family toxin [Epilithonimonas hispanica]REC68602.1 type II toxin-antitoxin system RelE/ParE family toxin [Epilithonimonas hispanica]